MTATAGPGPTTEDTYGIPPDVYHRRTAILAVLCLSLITVVVAVSSLNVAIPRLQEALDASPTQLQWIVDSYALVFAGFLLPSRTRFLPTSAPRPSPPGPASLAPVVRSARSSRGSCSSTSGGGRCSS